MKKKTINTSNKESTEKTLFDHIKAITQHQNPNYFDTLTEKEKKNWSNYMIQRFLSMNPNWITFISDMDPYVIGNKMPPEIMYKLYISSLPKSNIFLKYIKNSNNIKMPKRLIELMIKYFEISSRECEEYITILSLIDPENIEITSMLEKFGVDTKEIKKIIRELK